MASDQSIAAGLPGGDDSLLNVPFASHSNTILALGLVAILATLIIPLPTMLLDLLLACSISLSLAVLIVTLSSKEALELSTFPSLLLFTTLFRLSLNVASTRLILLQGNAGQIIQTFGGFVAGGSLVVGLVIFLILVIIQFIVITKGAERISEVSARFTLDAMPGKQMAIDASTPTSTPGSSPKPRPTSAAARSSRKASSTAPWTAPASSSAATPKRA